MIGDLVLDTSVVIAALRRVPGIEEKLEEAERLWLPIIALGELELGVELASNVRAHRSAVCLGRIFVGRDPTAADR